DAGPLPVAAPPRRRMKAPGEILGPPPLKVIGNRTVDLLHQPRPGDRYRATRLHEPREVVQIQVVRAVVEERVDRHDRVEELRGEWQRPRISVDREHAVLDAGVPDPPQVLR